MTLLTLKEPYRSRFGEPQKYEPTGTTLSRSEPEVPFHSRSLGSYATSDIKRVLFVSDAAGAFNGDEAEDVEHRMMISSMIPKVTTSIL
ncbi:hypothetical protein F2Q70_00017576 [Brassica cretica]|uniref:Uncharacterized protein n=2 Tax=Brassica TaxID=3705 RepID=A0A3N6QGH5_BRACR|nr:hypothetical protein F2Q70_00017576 [Brassica cretica]KAF2598442.1 hypothetical protein F2Q68_00010516 [Brassica cretica]KAF3535508.1 hypothetical protein F2Q69_00023234 [Brassica cretica]CAF1918615.1 unnamed protein product [Brassica napus]